MRGDGKSSSRGIQLRLLRGRWRNAGIPSKRRSPTSGIRTPHGGAPLFGGGVQTFRWQTYAVRKLTTNGDWLGLLLKLPVWLVGYFAEVTAPPSLRR